MFAPPHPPQKFLMDVFATLKGFVMHAKQQTLMKIEKCGGFPDESIVVSSYRWHCNTGVLQKYCIALVFA
jgi:hypothetical protein